MSTRKDVIQIRVSEEEKQRISELAEKAGISPSLWVRSRALGDPLGPTVRVPDERPKEKTAIERPVPAKSKAIRRPDAEAVGAGPKTEKLPDLPKIAPRHWAP